MAVGEDESLGNNIEVTVIATGFENDILTQEQQKEFDFIESKLINKEFTTKKLLLYFSEDEYSPKEIGEMISLLSDVYKSIGGDGLVISGEEIMQMEIEVDSPSICLKLVEMEDSEKSKIIIVPVSGINPDLFNKLFDKLIKSINEYFDIHDNFSSNNSSHDETSISKLKNLGEETFKTAKIEDERVKAEIINTYANIEFKKINIERKNEKAKLDNLKKLKEELLKDIKIKCSFN